MSLVETAKAEIRRVHRDALAAVLRRLDPVRGLTRHEIETDMQRLHGSSWAVGVQAALDQLVERELAECHGGRYTCAVVRVGDWIAMIRRRDRDLLSVNDAHALQHVTDPGPWLQGLTPEQRDGFTARELQLLDRCFAVVL